MTATIRRSRLRRLAREAALRALYSIELGQATTATALEEALAAFTDEDQAETVGEDADLDPAALAIVSDYARTLTDGAWRARGTTDPKLAALIPRYDFFRLAAIDRSILRLGAYELDAVDFVPPAVTLNEAVELAKRYSTTESGRFVNGVLGNYAKSSPKADWTPGSAPQDPDLPEIERVERTPEPVVEVETVAPESEEAKLGEKFGKWTLRTEDVARLSPDANSEANES